MGLLNVSREQWEIAQTYFANHSSAKKLAKSRKEAGHFSFIQVEGNIYAIANTHVTAYLGKGGFAKVKLAENSDGVNFAVKIEGKGIDRRSLKEIAAMKILGKHVGAMERELTNVKNFWNKEQDKKPLLTRKVSYKIVALEQGKDLFDLLHHNANPLSSIQKIQIAIKICQALRHIHELGVIHADIKPDNILVNITENDIEIAILDFGFSIILPKDQMVIKNEPKGTHGFIAPEIYNKDAPKTSLCEFSFASDIYALGMMFKNHFGFTGSLFDEMTHDDRERRPSLDTIEAALTKFLELKQKPAQLPTRRPLPSTPVVKAMVEPVQAPVKQSGAFFIAQLEALLAKPRPVHKAEAIPLPAAKKSPTAMQYLREQQNKLAPMQQLTADLINKLAQRERSTVLTEVQGTTNLKC